MRPGGSTMKRKLSETRRRFLAFLGASQVSLISVRSEAQPKQLELAWYSNHQTLGELFADKVTELSLGAVKVALDGLPCLGVPLPTIANLSDLRVLQCAGVLKHRTRFRAFCRTDACYHIRRSRDSPSNCEALLQHRSRPARSDFTCDATVATRCAMEHFQHSHAWRPQGNRIRTTTSFILGRTRGLGKAVHPTRCAARFPL